MTLVRVTGVVVAFALASQGCKKHQEAPVVDTDAAISSAVATPPTVASLEPPVAADVTNPPAEGRPTGRTTTTDKAREAALEGRMQEVRDLLERRVRAGRGTAEEVRLVRAACKATRDAACVEDIRTKYP